VAESFKAPDYLPNRRRETDIEDPYNLPRQQKGTTPQMHGRYPDFDVLAEADHWDETTRELVAERVQNPPPIRFFNESQARTLSFFCDVVCAQDSEPRIPVLSYIDRDMYEGRLDGFQHAEMPDDREVFKLVAQGLDEAARDRGSQGFDALALDEAQRIVSAFSQGLLAVQAWNSLSVDKAWAVVMRYILKSFYAHPWAWNEIGFAGPAYPRGFSRLGADQKEHWEGEEALNLDPVVDTKRRGAK
jgi:hypothetical protein